jgi:hypothetical protein
MAGTLVRLAITLALFFALVYIALLVGNKFGVRTPGAS